MTPPVLELVDVTAAYGPFRALFGVSLTLQPASVLAMLGANGAGKTTVARIATGLVAPSSGQVLVDGNDFTGAATYRFARAGVAHAPEGRSVFATLTVEENLVLSFRRTRGRKGADAGLQEAYELFPRLGERRRQMAGTLSGGEQRMLSLSRVLVEQPSLLVADELSLGLAPIIVDSVYESLNAIRTSGTALLIVEQHIGHALAIADEVAVLDHGEISWRGSPADAHDVVVGGIFGADG